jgi:hypothetical protein
MSARAKRQAEFLECVVELIRAHAKHPDLRFGQLLVNALKMHDSHGDDVSRLFYLEGAEISQRVREFADKAV